MDSINPLETHHFETALYSPLFKGIKQKKRYTYLSNFDVPCYASLYRCKGDYYSLQYTRNQVIGSYAEGERFALRSVRQYRGILGRSSLLFRIFNCKKPILKKEVFK
jgi:hypothetical protein